MCRHITESCNKAIQETVGYGGRTRQPDWWLENEKALQPLLDAKKAARATYDITIRAPNQTSETARKAHKAYQDTRNKARYAVKQAQSTWWLKKGEQLSNAYEAKDYKVLFNFWKKLNVPVGATTIASGLKDKDGNLLNENDAKRARWREHFQGVLNMPSFVDPETVNTVEQRPFDENLANTPTRDEVKHAVLRLSNGKTAGKDEITAEMLKHGGQPLVDRLHELVLAIWEDETVPQEWRDAVIIPLPKKGDRQICDNWRGISLLSVAGKAFVKILEIRMSKFAEQVLNESQAGFRVGRGCIDMIFVARQLAEKARERHSRLLACFFDLKKAYDTVNREALWGLLGKYGVPPKVVNLLRSLYTNMKASVEIDGQRTDEFEVNNGLRQGCVISCVLFNLFFDRVVAEALQSFTGDVDLSWRRDRPLSNTNKSKAKTKCKPVRITDLRFADDLMATAHTPQKLQLFIDRFATAATRWGLTVSVSKTNIVDQPPPREQHKRATTTRASTFTIDGQTLDEVPRFPYLGSIMSNDAEATAEITSRIGKASKVWNGLRGPVFKSKGLTVPAKLAVFKGAVLPALLYGAETWAVRSEHVHRLESFLLRGLRQIVGQPCTSRGCKPDHAILQQAGLPPMEIILRKARLRWLGHVHRMPDHRLPVQALYGELGGTRTKGGQHRRWKDCVQEDLKAVGLGDNWQQVASDRSQWYDAVRNGLDENRKAWLAEKETRRANRKYRNTFICPLCNKRLATEKGVTFHVAQVHRLKAEQRRELRFEALQKQTSTELVRCPVSGCSKAFLRDRLASLKQHITSGHKIRGDEQKQLIATLGSMSDGRARNRFGAPRQLAPGASQSSSSITRSSNPRLQRAAGGGGVDVVDSGVDGGVGVLNEEDSVGRIRLEDPPGVVAGVPNVRRSGLRSRI
jgi:transcription elongation factor Elf1